MYKYCEWRRRVGFLGRKAVGHEPCVGVCVCVTHAACRGAGRGEKK